VAERELKTVTDFLGPTIVSILVKCRLKIALPIELQLKLIICGSETCKCPIGTEIVLIQRILEITTTKWRVNP